MDGYEADTVRLSENRSVLVFSCQTEFLSILGFPNTALLSPTDPGQWTVPPPQQRNLREDNNGCHRREGERQLGK